MGLLLVATDLHTDAEPLLDAAAREAAAFGHDLLLVHAEALPVVLESAEFGAVPIDPKVWAAREEADSAMLAELASRLSASGCKVSTRLVDGDAASSILQVADEVRPDRIVIGIHTRHGLGFLVPSVAASVVKRAACPVLVVPVPEATQQ